MDWIEIARRSAFEIRECLRNVDIDHVVAVDETFIRFRESCDKAIVPVGTKRVGRAHRTDNEKSGVTLVVAADLTSSLLPPFVIATAKFRGTLMREWAHYSKSALLFNQTHWMTQTMVVVFLHWLTLYLPGKSIGNIYQRIQTAQFIFQYTALIWDRSSTHSGKEIDQWVQEYNSKTEKKIFLHYIPEGMTSIMQVNM